MTAAGPRVGLLPRLGFPGGRLAHRYGASALLNATGTGLFYPFSILYLHGVLRLSLGFVGVGFAIATLVSIACAGAVGRRIDRIGARRVLVVAVALRIASRVAYLFAAAPAIFLLGAVLDTVCMRLSQLSEQVLVAGLSHESNRASWYALSRTALNAGMGLGSVAGGVLISATGGYDVLLYGNIAGFAVAALLFARLPVARTARITSPAVRPKLTREVLRDGVFLQICAADALLLLVGLVFELAMPVSVVEVSHAPAWVVSWVFVLNTVLITVLQGFATRGMRRITLFRAVAVGAVLNATGMALLIVGRSGVTTVLVVGTIAVVVYTCGEIIAGVAASTAIANLAPEQARGSYLSLNHMLLGVASALAPIVMAVTMRAGPWLNWLALAAVSGVVAVRVAGLDRPTTEPIPRTEAALSE